jgi:N-methylhydantoinase B/oxoprolinase/acetone carboxylase alpha subunit
LIEASGAVKELPGRFSITVRPGDVIEIETPGGGGFGRPVDAPDVRIGLEAALGDPRE